MKKTILTIGPLLYACISAAPALAGPAAMSGAPVTADVITHSSAVVADARPIEDLQLAAQRLRDAIHEMLNEPAGPKRAEMIASADHALATVDAAMANLPSELLIADATNSPRQRSEDRLKRASENLDDAVRALATEPRSTRRNEAMDKIRTALSETHELMQRIPRSPVASADETGR